MKVRQTGKEANESKLKTEREKDIRINERN